MTLGAVVMWAAAACFGVSLVVNSCVLSKVQTTIRGHARAIDRLSARVSALEGPPGVEDE